MLSRVGPTLKPWIRRFQRWRRVVPRAPVVSWETSRPDKYYFGSVGMRWPNKFAMIGAGFTKGGNVTHFRSPPWVVPAGTKMLLAFPNHYNIEDSATVNEQLLPNDVTIEAVSCKYTDATAAARIITASAMTLGGILRSDGTGGGTVVSLDVTHDIPANSLLRFAVAYSMPDNGTMWGGYAFRKMPLVLEDESARKHPTSSFATVVNSGAALTSNNGSGATTAWSIGGYQPGPACLAVMGADGRPVVFLLADSLTYGKGTPDIIAPDRRGGLLEPGLVSVSGGGYIVPCCNTAIAGSRFSHFDPTSGDYDPQIHRYRRALIDQIVAMNSGVTPWTHYIVAHNNNSEQPTLSAHISLKKKAFDWLQTWHSKPIIDCSFIPKATSTDGFRTTANQTVVGYPAVRTGYRAAGIAGTIDPRVVGFIDLMAPLAAGTDDASLVKHGVKAFTATLTRDIAADAADIYLSAAPAVGAALCLDPLSGAGLVRIVTAVTTVTAGAEYLINHTAGASSATWPAKAAGTLVGETPTADGNPALFGTHLPKPQNDLIAAATGPNSILGIKLALKASVSGAWV